MGTSGPAAVAKALATTTWPAGLCLNFVQHMYGVGTDSNDSNGDGVTDGIGAAQEWNSIPEAHRFHTTDPMAIPRGAVGFSYSPTPNGKIYGHTWIGLGGGQMRTTSGAGKVTTESIARWVSLGYTLKGWSDWISDTQIDGIAVAKDAAYDGALGSRVLRVRAQGSDVLDLQNRLNALPTALPLLSADGDYYTASAARVSEFQGQHGLGVDGVFGGASYTALLEAEKPPVVVVPEPPVVVVPEPPVVVVPPVVVPPEPPVVVPPVPVPAPTKAPNWLTELVRIILRALHLIK